MLSVNFFYKKHSVVIFFIPKLLLNYSFLLNLSLVSLLAFQLICCRIIPLSHFSSNTDFIIAQFHTISPKSANILDKLN